MANGHNDLRQMAPDVRLQLASLRLDEVRRAQRILTSRLHIWLPALAIGVPVRLQESAMVSCERLSGYNLGAELRADLFPSG